MSDVEEVGKKRKRNRKGRQQRRRKASKFLDEAAGEGSESEEEEADSNAELELDDTSYIDNYKLGKTEDQIAREIEEKYKHRKSHGVEVPEQSYGNELPLPKRMKNDSSYRFTQGALPKAGDPKVFAVKCKGGTARQLVARIVNKCYAYRMGFNHEKKRIDLGIISVFSVDHVKEWIYIESYRQVFVENAVKGLENLFMFKILLVDPAELMQLMDVQREKGKDDLKLNGLARYRAKGSYQNDLCQIVSLDGNRAKVRIIPREDFVQKSYIQSRDVTKRQQRLFLPSVAIGVRENQSTGEFIWGDLTFDRDGYLIKDVLVRYLAVGEKMIKPDMIELDVFFKHDRQKVESATATSGQAEVEFHVGDEIRVTRGPLEGVVGTILEQVLSSGWLLINTLLHNVELKVETSHCVKYFPIGTHVCVERGQWNGESGTVIQTTGEMLRFLCDRTQIEKTVMANSCKKTKVISKTGSHSFGEWRLFDLVMLADGRTVGVIVRLTPEAISILTTHNDVRDVVPSVVQKILRSSRLVNDAMNNPVKIRDTVSTATEAMEYFEGTVEQMYFDTVFVRTKSRENSGLVAAPVKSLYLRGGKYRPKSKVVQQKHAQQPPPTGLPAQIATEEPTLQKSVGWEPGVGLTVPWGEE